MKKNSGRVFKLLKYQRRKRRLIFCFFFVFFFFKSFYEIFFFQSFLASLTSDGDEAQILNSNDSEPVPNGDTTDESSLVSDDPST